MSGTDARPMKCPNCSHPLDAGTDSGACSDACRVTLRRDREELTAQTMAELLRQFSMVTPGGDPAIYDALHRESARVLSEYR